MLKWNKLISLPEKDLMMLKMYVKIGTPFLMEISRNNTTAVNRKKTFSTIVNIGFPISRGESNRYWTEDLDMTSSPGKTLHG